MMINYVNNVIIHAETTTNLLSVYPVDKEQVLGHIECCLVPQQQVVDKHIECCLVPQQQVVDKHTECCSVPQQVVDKPTECCSVLQQQVVYLPNTVQFLNNIPMSSYIVTNAPTITVFMTMSW